MFGGKLEAGPANVTEELWVFHTSSRTWSQVRPAPGHALVHAVEGHSAHMALLQGGKPVMVVLFGYSPVYSYISSVQEYNIRECWLGSVCVCWCVCALVCMSLCVHLCGCHCVCVTV